MRKPDPTRFTGRKKRQPDTLEMKGFTAPVAEKPPADKRKKPAADRAKTKKTAMPPRHRDSIPSGKQAIMTSGMTSRHHDAIIELIRKTLKVYGKEPSTHRLTLEEKRALVDIVYAYKGRGIRTSENEIARIAINYLVADYRENGKSSLLHKVLKALHE